MSEQKIQTDIIRYLTSVGAYTEKVIAGTRSGLPDVRGCMPVTITQDMVGKRVGIFFAVEVKKPETKNDASPLQLMNIRKIQEAGGKAIVAWTVGQVQELIKELDNEYKKC